jgi:glycolate oxidase FAD binding subunit
MTLQPMSIEALAALVPAHPRLRVRGGGTKEALSSPTEETRTLDLSALAGITEHTPEECTFTALAGTRIANIDGALAPHGQYLPFDPPLAAAGATLGGTVAAGVNGSCRYRFGGIRDFLIGARIVDGRGHVIHSGGKVVKNAAGFLLHQSLIGSCGALGILAELTFKVFPTAEARVTIRVDASDLPSAAELITTLQRARFDFEAIDLEPPGTIRVRLGGLREALHARVAAVERVIGRRAAVASGKADEAIWQEAREFTWAPRGLPLVRVPITPPVLLSLDNALSRSGAVRRYTVAANLALIAWSEPLDTLATLLSGMDLTGQVLFGPAGRPFIGAVRSNVFEERLRAVMDPDGRFR